MFKLVEQLADLYLDRFNDYLTDEKFAEHHGLTVEAAKLVLQAGKLCHEQRVELYNERIKESYAS